MEQKLKKPVAPAFRPLRYNILLKLQAYPPSMRAKIKRRIMTKCKCSKSTLHRWFNCRHGESIDIPATAIKVIADNLNCEMDDLFNPEEKE